MNLCPNFGFLHQILGRWFKLPNLENLTGESEIRTEISSQTLRGQIEKREGRLDLDPQGAR